MNKKKILFLGTSNQSSFMISTARALGYYAIVTDYLAPELSAAKLLADECWEISTDDLAALENKCKEAGVTGVLAGASDFNHKRAVELSERLGLRHFCSCESWRYSNDKKAFKQLCRKVGARVAIDYEVGETPSPDELRKIKYPVVVKAVNLSGNRGMSFCSDESELLDAVRYARGVSGKKEVVIEKMMTGPEVSAVYVMAQGEVRLLAFCSMNSQPGEPTNCYSVTTTESMYLRKFLREDNDAVKRVLKAAGCREGFAWVEMMVDEGEFTLLEMGYRLCGDEINIPLRTVTGFDVHRLILDYAAGRDFTANDLPSEQADYYDRVACVYSLWSNSSGVVAEVDGVEEACAATSALWDGSVRVGSEIPAFRLLGEFLLDVSDATEMCEAIKKINELVSIRDENGEEMIIRYTDYRHLMSTSRAAAIE